MKLVAAKKSNKLIFSGIDDFRDDDGDGLNGKICKCIEEVLTDDDFFGEITTFFVDSKSGYFKAGIEFDSALDRENVWRNRFSFGKRYNLFIEPYLSAKQNNIKNSLIECWYKFKKYKVDKEEQAPRFLVLQGGLLFDSKVFQFDSNKVITSFQKHLNGLCQEDIFPSTEVDDADETDSAK